MWTYVLSMLGTALLSSVFTLVLAGWIFERRIRPRLEEHVDAEVDSAIERFGEEIERRVRRGVRSGVSSLPSAEVLGDATRNVARTGADIVGLGLASLLGGRRRAAGSPSDPVSDPGADPDPGEPES